MNFHVMQTQCSFHNINHNAEPAAKFLCMMNIPVMQTQCSFHNTNHNAELGAKSTEVL